MKTQLETVTRRRFLGLFSASLALPLISRSAVVADAKHKVVWHADFADPRRFSAMLTSVYNMVNTYQHELEEYDVRIVFVSYGIRFITGDALKDTPFAEDEALRERREDLTNRVRSLRGSYGVGLELCDITRNAVQLPKEKLIEGVTAVPSGVVRIAELQNKGYAYLKME